MDDFNWVWETVAIFFVGKFILRLGGRKSISQMTITQTIVMIGIGSLLIQPIAEKNVFVTLSAALLFTLLMVIVEYLEVKFDAFETFSSGKSVAVIENGKPNMKNIKKLRLTADRLEMRLRQNGVRSIEDVKTATIEISGQLGYELKDEKRPLTKEDFITLMSEIADMKKLMRGNEKLLEKQSNSSDIFAEIVKKDHEKRGE